MPRSSLPLINPADPHAGYLARRAEIDAAIKRVLENGRYILGPEVALFEEEFADYLAHPHAIGVGSGTDALVLALKAGGVGPGDLVLTASLTAVATLAAIEQTGAAPLFADIDPASYTLAPQALEETINALKDSAGGTNYPRLKAIVPVHLYGCPADMPGIMDIAHQHDLLVVEDCAQSHGAAIDGLKTGCWGDLAAFSFYPTKNLGALGDGGAVVSSNGGLADRVRQMREYGWNEQRISMVPGINSRLDELQAAILRVKLTHLEAANQRRREIATAYLAALSESPLTLPASIPGRKHVYHQFVVRSSARSRLQQHLRVRGVATLVHYPLAGHQQPAYAKPDYRPLPLTHTEAVTGEVLSLPMFPELTDAAVLAVCEAVDTFRPGS